MADATNYLIWIAITAGGVILIGAGVILLFKTTEAGNAAGQYSSAVKTMAKLPLKAVVK
jgi:hypothetical protein